MSLFNVFLGKRLAPITLPGHVKVCVSLKKRPYTLKNSDRINSGNVTLQLSILSLNRLQFFDKLKCLQRQ